MYKLAVEGARQGPEGRVAMVEAAVPLDASVASIPKKRKDPTREMLLSFKLGERAADKGSHSGWK